MGRLSWLREAGCLGFDDRAERPSRGGERRLEFAGGLKTATVSETDSRDVLADEEEGTITGGDVISSC